MHDPGGLQHMCLQTQHQESACVVARHGQNVLVILKENNTICTDCETMQHALVFKCIPSLGSSFREKHHGHAVCEQHQSYKRFEPIRAVSSSPAV